MDSVITKDMLMKAFVTIADGGRKAIVEERIVLEADGKEAFWIRGFGFCAGYRYPWKRLLNSWKQDLLVMMLAGLADLDSLK